MLKNKHIRDVLLLFTLLLGILSLGTSSPILSNSITRYTTNVLAADNTNVPIVNGQESDPLTVAKETFITVKEYDQKVEDTFVDWVSDIKTQINKILQ